MSLRIQPPKVCKVEGIDLSPEAEGILPKSFVMMILGPPGSGKSHLISQLLGREDFYGKKFDKIFYFGPTLYQGLDQDTENTSLTIEENDILQIVQLVNEQQIPQCNVLFVFDDVIGQLYEKRTKGWMSNLFFNRRHLIKQGTLSILYTTQKFNKTPTLIRTATTSMFMSRVNQAEQNGVLRQMNIAMPPILFKAATSHLRPHTFMFCDLTTGEVYNDQFRRY